MVDTVAHKMNEMKAVLTTKEKNIWKKSYTVIGVALLNNDCASNEYVMKH